MNFRPVNFLYCFFCASSLLLSAKNPLTNPFDNPVDDPGLPRVLLIGDSISIGYTTRVREILNGKVNVHPPKTNCRWSAYGDENILQWVGDE